MTRWSFARTYQAAEVLWQIKAAPGLSRKELGPAVLPEKGFSHLKRKSALRAFSRCVDFLLQLGWIVEREGKLYPTEVEER